MSDSPESQPPPVRRAAIVGAGPSGFYAAEQLLGQGFEVDVIDRLPTPFGLVRAGVAPDHPKIKSVTRMYEKTASRPGFRYFGGVELGRDIDGAELLERYHAVVYAIGTSNDNRLGIPGEELAGSHPATDFVGWYNGHPDCCEHRFDLGHPRAVVIGNGNVALDVARMLVLSDEELAATDTADHALDALRAAAVEEVVILGRRGPAQAAFTNPELRELGELSRADVVVAPGEVELDPLSAAWLASDQADSTARRNLEILTDYSSRGPTGKPRRVVLRFLLSPVEILGDDQGRVRAVKVARNRIAADDKGRLSAVPTAEHDVIECGLVLRAVGYRGRPIDGVPFEARRGLIPNEGGRVLGDDGRHRPGQYAVGWIKRGPSGVIGTNKKDAADTVARILEDAEHDRLNQPRHPDGAEVEPWLRARVDGLVTWQGWQSIDRHERTAGEPAGRPRIKLVRMADMWMIAAPDGESTPAGSV
ncbi:MAG: FAD-dependent oxidoreductase [Solirubrobacterales bacterium]|nr:FAD-dependent oxidoreductase [Solirubrobacterales bacterium]